MSRICVEETGLTCRAWQAKARIRRSMSFLAEGYSVREAAKSVGYEDYASFSHAFSKEVGLAPRSWLKGQNTGSVAINTNSEELLPLLSYSIPSRVNDFHLLLWQSCGVSRVDLGDRIVKLERGQTLWIPSGVWHAIHVESGGIIIPVGQLSGHLFLRRHHMKVGTVSDLEALKLLYLSTVNYTILRPYPFVKNDISRLLPVSVVSSINCSPVKKMMDAECGDLRSLADWSLELGIERGKLANMFERESGCSWGYWKREKRMTAARHLLSDTDRSVSSISRRLGYSNVSGFSRSFTEVHGVTPTEFREKNYLPLLVDLPPDLHD